MKQLLDYIMTRRAERDILANADFSGSNPDVEDVVAA